MTKRRRFVFALITLTLGTVASLVMLFALDLYAHHRANESAGLNVWGYRGPALGGKQAGEVRVAMLGGSTMFGYGVRWEQAIPALTERLLNERRSGDWPTRVSVANLAYNNEGAYATTVTLQDYSYLDYEIAVLYDGYNDLKPNADVENVSVYRHESPVYRLTGYFPILPLVLREKALALTSSGTLEDAYAKNGRVVFRPNPTNRAAAAALDSVAQLAESIERQAGHFASPRGQSAHDGRSGCAAPWDSFCDSIKRSLTYLVSANKHAIVLRPPRLGWPSIDARLDHQQGELDGMLQRVFADQPNVHRVNLTDAVNAKDERMSFDGMHLTAEGNARIAAVLVAELEGVVKRIGTR